jgi:D-alanyl-D-alanine carboxypeptidase
MAPLLAQPRTLDRDLAVLLKTHKLPGAVAVVFNKESVLDSGAAGVRETGKNAPIAFTDRFHIGSNAKGMLATLVATLVEDEKLSWDSRPSEILKIQDAGAYSKVTLEDLLNHHGGLPAFEEEDGSEWRAWIANRQAAAPAGQPVKRFSRWVLTQPPAVTPGTKFLYSNAGYSVVAAVAEVAGGADWKSLLVTRLFAPLKMDAGFGLPAADNPDQPRGHYETKNNLKVQDSKDSIAPFIQPAGNVQVSILEYIKFLQLHLSGLQGIDGVVRSATIRRMHKPRDKMGFGWKISDFQGAPASFHTGSADTFYAIATLLPTRDLGVAVLINAGGQRAETASLAATRQFLPRFFR